LPKNRFSAHSGRLLTGGDVKRPLEFCPIVRKKKKYHRMTKKKFTGGVSAESQLLAG